MAALFVTPSALIAQSLVEHGALDSLASSFQRSGDRIGIWFGHVSPTTWVILSVVAVVALLVVSRRR
jgi:hypothetical protein